MLAAPWMASGRKKNFAPEYFAVTANLLKYKEKLELSTWPASCRVGQGCGRFLSVRKFPFGVLIPQTTQTQKTNKH
jgi:hypothetical protein